MGLGIVPSSLRLEDDIRWPGLPLEVGRSLFGLWFDSTVFRFVIGA